MSLSISGNRQSNYRLILGFVIFFSVYCQQSFAQVTVRGPKCAIKGLVYQYDIKSQQQMELEVCVTGGKIQNTTSACRKQSAASDVRVIWDSTVSSGSITVKLSGGNTTVYQVQITKPLTGGRIATESVFQTIETNKKPSDIRCGLAENGNCSVTYSYQWQKSVDYLKWASISGATARDLSFSVAPTEPTFYRRVVIEIQSGAQAYSDIATIIVTPVPSN